MSTIKNAALLAVCLAVGTVTAAQAELGHRGYRHHAWHKHFTKVPMGATVHLKGSYDAKPGEAFLFIRGAKFHVKVIAWTPKGVKLVMPVMKLAGDYNYAKLIVFGKHGRPCGCFPIELLPPVVKKAVPAKGGVTPKAGGVAPKAGGAEAPKAGGAEAPKAGAVAPKAGGAVEEVPPPLAAPQVKTDTPVTLTGTKTPASVLDDLK